MKQKTTWAHKEAFDLTLCLKLADHLITQTWKLKTLTVFALLLYEGCFFSWQLAHGTDCTLVEMLDRGYLKFAFMLILFSFLVIDYARNSEGRSKICYLFRRTGLSVKETVVTITIVDIAWYILLWSVQALALLGLALGYGRIADPDFFGPYTIYMMFQVSPFASMVFPISSLMGLVRNALLIMALSVSAGWGITESFYGLKSVSFSLVYVFAAQQVLAQNTVYERGIFDILVLTATIFIYAVYIWYKYSAEGGEES